MKTYKIISVIGAVILGFAAILDGYSGKFDYAEVGFLLCLIVAIFISGAELLGLVGAFFLLIQHVSWDYSVANSITGIIAGYLLIKWIRDGGVSLVS